MKSGLKDDKWIQGWAKFMITIWREKIDQLEIYDTRALVSSVDNFQLEGTKDDFTISHSFLEYGLYVDKGVGKEFKKGNAGNIHSDRIRKPWFGKKYYSSYMNLKFYLEAYYKRDFVMMMKETLEK